MVKDDGEEAKLLRCSNHDVIVIIIVIIIFISFTVELARG